MKKEKDNIYVELSKKEINMLTELIAQNGDRFGNEIIEMIDLEEVDPIRLGTTVIGIAKAWAAVRDIARRTGVEVDTLFRKERASYSRQMEKMNH